METWGLARTIRGMTVDAYNTKMQHTFSAQKYFAVTAQSKPAPKSAAHIPRAKILLGDRQQQRPPTTPTNQNSLRTYSKHSGTQLRDPINSGLTRWRLRICTDGRGTARATKFSEQQGCPPSWRSVWIAGLLDCCSVTLCCCAAFLLSWVFGFWRVLCAGFPRSYLSAFLVLFCS